MKALVTLLLIASTASVLQAYEVEGNPDRKMSFGLNYDHSVGDSEYSFGALRMSDFNKSKGNHFLIDTRIPLSSIFTFQARFGFSKTNNDLFTGEKVENNDKSFGVGIRAYLP